MGVEEGRKDEERWKDVGGVGAAEKSEKEAQV